MQCTLRSSIRARQVPSEEATENNPELGLEKAQRQMHGYWKAKQSWDASGRDHKAIGVNSRNGGQLHDGNHAEDARKRTAIGPGRRTANPRPVTWERRSEVTLERAGG